MSKLGAKRQITLPADYCRELGIEPGDDLHCFVANGQLTLIKKGKGTAHGILKKVKSKARISDEESRDSGRS